MLAYSLMFLYMRQRHAIHTWKCLYALFVEHVRYYCNIQVCSSHSWWLFLLLTYLLVLLLTALCGYIPFNLIDERDATAADPKHPTSANSAVAIGKLCIMEILQAPANVCRCKPSDRIHWVHQCGGERWERFACMVFVAFEKFNFHFHLTFDPMPFYVDIHLLVGGKW